MIDIICTYVNERDSQWQQDFEYWKWKEINQGRTRLSNRQAFGEERTREWDAFKYWFRAVEKNCPWVNKVVLVVQNERHVPEWINKDCKKLKIVYHDEYIPKELLPTFNAMPIGMYFGYIKDLAEKFIMCDDDFYFINPISEDRFFKDDKPVHPENKIPYKLYDGDCLTCQAKVFYHTLNNNLILEKQITNKKIKYGFYHLPSARLKSFEKEILDKYKNEIMGSFIRSKFRHKTNVCNYMFDDLLKLCNKTYVGDPYYNWSYCTLTSKVNFDDYKDKDMVCFNDTEIMDDYEKTKKAFIEFLEKKFPKKSMFEK